MGWIWWLTKPLYILSTSLHICLRERAKPPPTHKNIPQLSHQHHTTNIGRQTASPHHRSHLGCQPRPEPWACTHTYLGLLSRLFSYLQPFSYLQEKAPSKRPRPLVPSQQFKRSPKSESSVLTRGSHGRVVFHPVSLRGARHTAAPANHRSRIHPSYLYPCGFAVFWGPRFTRCGIWCARSAQGYGLRGRMGGQRVVRLR